MFPENPALFTLMSSFFNPSKALMSSGLQEHPTPGLESSSKLLPSAEHALYILKQQQVLLFGSNNLPQPSADQLYASDIVSSMSASLEPLVWLPQHILSKVSLNGSEAQELFDSSDRELVGLAFSGSAGMYQEIAPPPPSQPATATTWTQQAQGESHEHSSPSLPSFSRALAR